MIKARNTVGLFKSAVNGFVDDNVMLMGAALAYYTIFSIAPLLIISIAVAGLVFGAEASRGEIFTSLQGLLGPDGAKGVEAMVQGASSQKGSGIVATVVGLITLLFGASAVFGQLQQALNLIWKVRPKPGTGMMSLLRQRFLSFSMIVVIAFVLLVSLVVSAGLSALGKYLSGALPGGVFVWQVLNQVVSLGVVSLLFAAVFKILPDVKLAWRQTWVGAVVTAVLFTLGKIAIGAYIGHSSVASAYGAAGSLIVLLLWVFYSSCILFFGAEFTKAYVTRGGREVSPVPGAEMLAVQPLSAGGAQNKKKSQRVA